MDFKLFHSQSLVIDTHCDTILKMVNSSDAYDIKQYHAHENHVDIPRLRIGGVKVQFFACYIEAQYKPDRSLKRTLEIFDTFYRTLEENAPDLHQILNSGDVQVALAENKIGALLAVEGGEALEGDIRILRMLHRLGVRSIGLTWNERNQIAEGVGECRSGSKLTEFGVQVIEEMNRLGIIVDVSHISEPGFWDVLAVTKKPIIASHSNSKQICNHRRNLTDAQIIALAKNGGVMGMNMAAEFVHESEEPTIEHVVDHIEHIIGLVGSKHVGIGADYDGITLAAKGLEDVSKIPALTEAMYRRKFSEDQIRDVLGLNFMRVINEVLK
ncbi:MAG: dipeptidase [bacterium]|nr:dipeptidase [bacterium]